MPVPPIPQRGIRDSYRGEILTSARVTEITRAVNDHATTLANMEPQRAGEQTSRFVTVKITSTLADGVYNAKIYAPPGAAPGGALTEAQLGTLPAEDDCIVWEPGGIIGGDLPLNGLVTRGEIVGSDSAEGGTGLPIVQIPPPGIRDVRYNSSTNKLQVAYVPAPAEDQWVDKVTFSAC